MIGIFVGVNVPSPKPQARMSNLRNTHVALLIL